MTRTFELGDLIAEGQLTYEPTQGSVREVRVRIGKPVLHSSVPRDVWMCPCQLMGLDRDHVIGIFGADAMQALVLAIHTFPAELAAFARTHGGRFLHHGRTDTTVLSACRVVVDSTRHLADETREAALLNVDLDLASSEDLTPLVRALESKAFVLERPAGYASFELNDPASPTDPGPVLQKLVQLVLDLPASPRGVWDRASSRVLDVGIQSANRTSPKTYQLNPDTLRAAADVGATIAITIYAPRDDAANHDSG